MNQSNQQARRTKPLVTRAQPVTSANALVTVTTKGTHIQPTALANAVPDNKPTERKMSYWG
jgi:hypothetical protein